MMYLRAGFAEKLKCKYSIYVKFSYNPTYVDLIKSLKHRAFNPNQKEWEIGWDEYTPFITLLNQYCIPYNGTDFEYSIQQLNEQVEKLQTIQKQEANVDASVLDTVEFKTQPFQYQKEGIAYGLLHDRFLIADEQGLGKSLQALNIARLKRGGKHCLVIVGYDSLQFNWLKEVQKHTNETARVLGQRINRKGNIVAGNLKERLNDIENLDKLEEFFLITTTTTLRQCDKQDYLDKKGKTKTNKDFYNANLLEHWCQIGEIGRIIVDEFQVFKNLDSSQTEALLKLRSCPYKIAATGTPIMNENIDLFTLMTWLGYEQGNYHEFRNRYCIMGGYKNKEIKGNKNNQELNQRLAQFMIRRKKEDVTDLPEKIYIDELLELNDKQYALYEKHKRLAKQKLQMERGNKNAIFAATLQLRKVTCHSKWVDEQIDQSVKFERTVQLVYEASQNDKKTIIFSNFSTPIDWLYEILKPYNPAKITGDTKDRMFEVDKFQNDASCKVILGTIGAMGTGLTLNEASNVIFLDEPWNRALKDQAVDRAHRIGTKNNVNIYTLICRDSVDEMVHKIVMKKGKIMDEIVDGQIEQLEKYILEEE